jgi:hypothetical protein
MTEFRLEGEIRLPGTAVHSLATAARRHGEPVTSAVRDAGRAAGEDIVHRIAALVSLAELDMADFWSAVNAETGARGLGTYEWEAGLGGHAELVVHRVVDAPTRAGRETGGRFAPFTEGFIEGLLGAAAEEPVAAVQAPHDGGEGIRYLVGSPTALRHVRLRLQSGASLEQALEGI